VTGLNSNGVTQSTPQTFANLKIAAGGRVLTTEATTTSTPLSQPDEDLASDSSVTFRWPRYGHNAALINNHSSTEYPVSSGKNVNELYQQMTVTSADVDPNDNQVHVRFVVAPILQNPGHTVADQPYYFVSLTKGGTGPGTGTAIYTDFNLSAQNGVPWKTSGSGTNEIDYLDWTLVDIPGNGQIAVGDTVTLTVIAAGCQPGGHFGKIYVDGVGTGGNSIPGLYVSGSGPAQANAGSDITYTFNYKNGSSNDETGVVISLPIPTGTTFKSDTLPAGVTCTQTPAVNPTLLTCTVAGTLAKGAGGSLSLTVTVNAATTGTVTEGSYSIKSNQETTLIGNKIVTTIGCTTDIQCLGGNWCNISQKKCVPTVANGSGMPTDTGHGMTPTINGTCNAGAAVLVCTGKTCETSDNECGTKNGNGCTVAANCRSAICDTKDLKCGYANGDGPCTVATQTNDCRTGSDCSTNGTCKTSGTCTVDGDCSATQWCKNSTHLCTDRIDNGAAVPSDTGHTPTLDGTCTTDAATAVCKSKVCDTDNDCGYKDGDGPCDSTNGGTVCRSGSCSANGKCRPAAGCNVDADCTGGDWCNESAHTCTGKIANGQPMPTDTGHTTPTLDGKCSAAAAALVCGSGVCDADDKCGYENDHGPCSADAGTADGGASASVCRSGVCDGKDDKCGYQSGDGPCTPGDGGAVEACRSSLCASDDLCADCITDKDCPTDQKCLSNHTCSGGGEGDGGVSDGGVLGDGGRIGDGGNGGSDASLADAGDDGRLEGGGCAMTTNGSNGDSPFAIFGVVTTLGLAVIRRRKNAA
ncbi:MAG TPA: hypothetical protein VF407_11425, partial [Polyangiaceae bacterium]